MNACPKGNDNLYVVEGIAGVYHYHLSLTGENMKPALCGETRVMHTECRVSSWGGKISHLRESYCKECEKKAIELGLLLVKPVEKEVKPVNIHEKLKASVYALKAIHKNLEPVLKDLEIAETEGLGVASIKTKDPGLCPSCRKSKICSAHNNSKIMAIKCSKYGERKGNG